jgi:hypothetical protein
VTAVFFTSTAISGVALFTNLKVRVTATRTKVPSRAHGVADLQTRSSHCSADAPLIGRYLSPPNPDSVFMNANHAGRAEALGFPVGFRIGIGGHSRQSSTATLVL